MLPTANVYEFRRPPEPTGQTSIDPVTNWIRAQAVADRAAVAHETGVIVAGLRARLNAKTDEVVQAILRQREIDAALDQAPTPYVPPFPLWVVILVALVAFAGDLSLNLSLLTYSGMPGAAGPAIPLSAYLADEVGFAEWLYSAIGAVINPKSIAGTALAMAVFFGAAVTGRWAKQRTSPHAAVKGWMVLAFHLSFLLTALALLALRDAAFLADPDLLSIRHLSWTLIGFQCFLYVASAYFVAANTNPNPDPASAQLRTEKKRLGIRLRQLIRQRADLAAPVTVALAGAHGRVARISAQALADAAAYRMGCLHGMHDAGITQVPDFLTSPLGEDLFPPVGLEPVPELPAPTVDAALDYAGSG